VHQGRGRAWPGRPWKWGRVVFPLTDPDGRLISLYGRAVGSNEKVPKARRHDILSGDKGFFGGATLKQGDGPLFICEGPFDALALAATCCILVPDKEGWAWKGLRCSLLSWHWQDYLYWGTSTGILIRYLYLLGDGLC
jgi:hypothetical protein